MKNKLVVLLAGAVLATTGLEGKAQSTNVPLGMITNNSAYVAVGAQEYLIQASSANLSQGYVSGTTSNWVEEGSNANFSANSAQFYDFDQWSDGNTNSARDFPVNSSIDLTAYFKKQKDSNGVAEDWKSQYGITNVLEDIDGDGMNNMAEYFTDTNPTNENSYFYTTIGKDIFGLYVGFPENSTNISCNVLESPSLLNPNWQPIYAFNGTGNPTNFYVNSTNTSKFFTGSAGRINP